MQHSRLAGIKASTIIILGMTGSSLALVGLGAALAVLAVLVVLVALTASAALIALVAADAAVAAAAVDVVVDAAAVVGVAVAAVAAVVEIGERVKNNESSVLICVEPLQKFMQGFSSWKMRHTGQNGIHTMIMTVNKRRVNGNYA